MEHSEPYVGESFAGCSERRLCRLWVAEDTFEGASLEISNLPFWVHQRLGLSVEKAADKKTVDKQMAPKLLPHQAI